MLENALLGLRDRPGLLALLLMTVNLLNILDFSFTLNVLAAGGAEANPVMRSLFDVGAEWAAIFKVLAVLAATVILWRHRRFRSALVATCLIASVFSAVVIYHLVLVVAAF